MANDKTTLYVLGGAAIIAAAYFITKKPAQQPQVIIVPGGGGGTGTPGEGTPSTTVGQYIQEGTDILGNLSEAFGTVKDIFGWGEPDAGEILANQDFDEYGNPIEP